MKSLYKHNITKHLYLDEVTWKLVKKINKDNVTMINPAVKRLHDYPNRVEVIKTVLL